MNHRKTTPICRKCGEKPVRRYGYFCTVRCAAEEGQDQAMAAAYEWCDRCGAWHDDKQRENCEDANLWEAEYDEEDRMLREGWS